MSQTRPPTVVEPQQNSHGQPKLTKSLNAIASPPSHLAQKRSPQVTVFLYFTCLTSCTTHSHDNTQHHWCIAMAFLYTSSNRCTCFSCNTSVRLASIFLLIFAISAESRPSKVICKAAASGLSAKT